MIAAGDIILIAASFIIPLACKRVRSSRWILGAIYLVLAAHHAVSVFNVYVFPLPGSLLDAHYFYRVSLKWLEAPEYRNFGVGTAFYHWILLINFFIAGTTSKLAAQSLSTVAYSLFLLYCIGLLARLQVRDEKVLALVVLVSGLVPSVWMFTSLTFREPFQLLGLAAAMYYFLLFVERSQIAYLVASWVGLLFMGLSHQVMLLYGAGVAILGLVMLQLERSRSWLKITLASLFIFLAVGISGWLVVSSIPADYKNDYLHRMLSGDGLMSAVVHYRSSIEEKSPRSAYGFSISAESPAKFTTGVARSYVSYLFGPTVLTASTSIDMVPVATTLLRWFAICISVIGLLARPGFAYRYMFAIALTLSLVWSIGTTNYGQALRHNGLTDWTWIVLSVTFIHAWWRGRSRIPPTSAVRSSYQKQD